MYLEPDKTTKFGDSANRNVAESISFGAVINDFASNQFATCVHDIQPHAFIMVLEISIDHRLKSSVLGKFCRI